MAAQRGQARRGIVGPGLGPAGSGIESRGGSAEPLLGRHRGRPFGGDRREVIGLEDLVVLNIETLEDVGLSAVSHRRIQQVRHAEPAVDGLEVAPDAYENDLFAAVGMDLAGDLGVDAPVESAQIAKDTLGLSAEDGGLPWTHSTLEDPDYQVPTLS